MKKYLVIGGEVMSRNDGQVHYVTAPQLCRLYKVNPEECYMVEERDPSSGIVISTTPDHLIVLRTRYDGNYQIPIPNKAIS